MGVISENKGKEKNAHIKYEIITKTKTRNTLKIY